MRGGKKRKGVSTSLEKRREKSGEEGIAGPVLAGISGKRGARWPQQSAGRRGGRTSFLASAGGKGGR